MTHRNTNPLPRVDIIDTFVISSVITIVLIRAFLVITGFPTVGSDSFHIAHMLWGGLALTIALLISLLAAAPNKGLLALTGGIGFGFFIDEIGKFVTASNDYFYEGTFFLIYVLMLLLWGASRWLALKGKNHSFLLPAALPKLPVERAVIVLWAGAQIVLTPFIASSFKQGSMVGLIAVCLLLVYSAWLLAGLLCLALNKQHLAAQVIRSATFLQITAILPFVYYAAPFIAAALSLGAVLVAIGLSEISVKDILRAFSFKTHAK